MSSEKKVKKERIAAAHIGSRSFPVKSNSDEKKHAAAECSSTHITVKVKDQDQYELYVRIEIKKKKNMPSETKAKIKKEPIADVKCRSTHITVKVKDQDGHEVHFRMRRNTKLKKLMDAYSAHKHQGVDSLVFIFDEMRLKGNATPDELKMEENSQIDVFVHQRG